MRFVELDMSLLLPFPCCHLCLPFFLFVHFVLRALIRSFVTQMFLITITSERGLLNVGFPSFTLFRSLSGHSSTNNPEKNVDFSFDGESTTKSEILNLGFDKGSEVAKVMLSDDGWYVPIVQALTSVLDQYHDLTNFPWWVIIATSTRPLQ